MKVLSLLLAVLGLFAFASAVDVLKSVIVSYPMSTPDHIVEQAKQAIEDAGGQITHNYKFIKYALLLRALLAAAGLCNRERLRLSPLSQHTNVHPGASRQSAGRRSSTQ
jgi:hypothetical protein